MLEFFRNGGFSMYPVLVFGLLTLGAAIHFAMRADKKVRNFIEPMYKVVVFSSVTGLLTDLATVCGYLESHELGAKFATTCAEGLKESLGPVIMGSSFLALTFLFVAIGQRRLDARLATA